MTFEKWTFMRWLSGLAFVCSCALTLEPSQAWSQAPVTALMSRPVMHGEELKVRVELSVEAGWQVYGPSAAQELGPITIALSGAPNHEISVVQWPEEVSIAAPEGGQSKGYDRAFHIEATVRQTPQKADTDSLVGSSGELARQGGPAPGPEGGEAEEAPSADEKAPLRASLTMSWMGCNSARLRESRSQASLKSACILGEAIFVLKNLPVTPPALSAASSSSASGGSKSNSGSAGKEPGLKRPSKQAIQHPSLGQN